MFVLQLCCGLQCYVAIVFCAFFFNYVATHYRDKAQLNLSCNIRDISSYVVTFLSCLAVLILEWYVAT